MRTTFIVLLAGPALLILGCRSSRPDVASRKPVPVMERRTVEFVQNSDLDIRQNMDEWQKDGWAVNSLSGRLSQPDGTIHRRAELSRTSTVSTSEAAYDDRRIAQIQRGLTTEAELLEWFEQPESRDASADGRMHLSWSFPGRTGEHSTCSGVLNVSLNADGKVEAYSAHQLDAHQNRQASNATHAYDDRTIAKIGRGETSEDQLLDWFGRPLSREAKPDRRTYLAWQFGNATGTESALRGVLNVGLSPEGKVEAYSAHRTPATNAK